MDNINNLNNSGLNNINNLHNTSLNNLNNINNLHNSLNNSTVNNLNNPQTLVSAITKCLDDFKASFMADLKNENEVTISFT